MRLSIVELSTLAPDKTRTDALVNSIEVAQLAEKLGFSRIWFAEHHGAAFVAGRAPEVMMATVAAQTKKIRVGSGSVLLNHYSPLKIAEVFSTLNELFPGRIDLGAGRATTGPTLDYALQQDRSRQFHSNSNEQITELVAWLENSFPAEHPFSKTPIHTIADHVDLHVLGSSVWSAGAAAALGLRYVFAAFINQAQAKDILDSYRKNFKSEKGPCRIAKPEIILSVHAVCAESEEEARRQLAPVHVMYANLSRGIVDSMLPTPDEAVAKLGGLPPLEKYKPRSCLIPRFIGGTEESVHKQLLDIAQDFAVEELMIQDMMTEYEARKNSLKMLAGLTTYRSGGL